MRVKARIGPGRRTIEKRIPALAMDRSSEDFSAKYAKVSAKVAKGKDPARKFTLRPRSRADRGARQCLSCVLRADLCVLCAKKTSVRPGLRTFQTVNIHQLLACGVAPCPSGIVRDGQTWRACNSLLGLDGGHPCRRARGPSLAQARRLLELRHLQTRRSTRFRARKISRSTSHCATRTAISR